MTRPQLRISTISTLALTLVAAALLPEAALAQWAGTTAATPASAGGLATQTFDESAEKAKFAYFETLGEKGWAVPRPKTEDTVDADTGGIRSKLASRQ